MDQGFKDLNLLKNKEVFIKNIKFFYEMIIKNEGKGRFEERRKSFQSFVSG